MRNVNRKSTTPVRYPRSNRMHPLDNLTSGDPGKCIPVAAIPMFREDSLAATISIDTEMLETKEILANRVNCRVTAFLVPFLAFERFKGSREELDRSYMGEAPLSGGTVIPFVENYAAGAHGADPILKSLGEHADPGDLINSGYREAYNLIINHRCRQLSKELPQRDLDDTTLAPAFWQHGAFAHIVADFDQAVMQGEVALNILESRMPVRVDRTTQGTVTIRNGNDVAHNLTANDTFVSLSTTANPLETSELFAQMEQNGISVSLADIDNARKVQAFAKLRAQFEGHDDDYIIDMLMQGLTIPDQHLKQPILLADRTVQFSQAKRYATTAGDLDDSATSGFASVDLRIRVPRLNTGGVVMVMVEYLPQQLWERQKDWYLHSRPKDGRPAHDFWPDAERDALDPEKVDVVYNGDIDVSHSNPTGYFGFDPMNARYTRARSRAGGKFFRPTADAAIDDARQRLWAVEGVDPKLTDDFFIAGDGVHKKPFLDEVGHPFELVVAGRASLNGNTQFGGVLIEATGNYEAVAEKVPNERIEKEQP